AVAPKHRALVSHDRERARLSSDEYARYQVRIRATLAILAIEIIHGTRSGASAARIAAAFSCAAAHAVSTRSRDGTPSAARARTRREIRHAVEAAQPKRGERAESDDRAQGHRPSRARVC